MGRGCEWAKNKNSGKVEDHGKENEKKKTKKNAIVKFEHDFPTTIASLSRPVIVRPHPPNYPPE